MFPEIPLFFNQKTVQKAITHRIGVDVDRDDDVLGEVRSFSVSRMCRARRRAPMISEET